MFLEKTLPSMAETSSYSKVCACCRAPTGTCSCALKYNVKLLDSQTTCRKCNRTDDQIAIGDPLFKHRLGFACPGCHVYTCESCQEGKCKYCTAGKQIKLFYITKPPFDHDPTLQADCVKLIKATMRTFRDYAKTVMLFNEYVHWIKLRAGKTDISDAPSKKVNTMWFNHITDTVKYAAFCQKVCGQFVHHDPALNPSRHSAIEVGMMLGCRTNLTHRARKTWGIEYIPSCPSMNVTVLIDGKSYAVTTTQDTMIRTFDSQIKQATGKTVNVLFDGSVAQPGRTLEYYGVKSGDTINAEKYVPTGDTPTSARGMAALLAALGGR